MDKLSPDEIRARLKETLAELKKVISLDEKFLKRLRAKDVITAEQEENIQDADSNENRVEVLLHIIVSSYVGVHQLFKEWLIDTDQIEAVNKILNKDVYKGNFHKQWILGVLITVIVALLLYPHATSDPRKPIAERFLEEYSRIPQWASPDAWSILMSSTYTPMTWVNVDRASTKLVERDLDDYHQFMVKENERPLFLVISGESGVGKSVFTRKLAYSWASYVINPSSLSPESRVVMKQFDYILPMRLKNLLPNDTLNSFISGQFGFLQQGGLLRAMIKEVSKNPQRTLCILDGYNEMTDDPPSEILDIIHRKGLSFCFNVLITSRGQTALPLQQQLGLTGREAVIKGFDITHIKAFVDKCYNGGDPSKTIFLAKLEMNKELLEIASNPLQLQMLCALAGNEEKAELIYDPTTLYMEILVTILRRYHKEKKGHMKGLSRDELIQTYKEEIKSLGVLGWHGCNQDLHKCPSTFPLELAKALAGEEPLNLGVLTYVMPNLTSQSTLVKFPYESFQQFLVALGHHLGNKELMHAIHDESLFREVITQHKKTDKALPMFLHQVDIDNFYKQTQKGDTFYNQVRIFYLKITQYSVFNGAWLRYGYKQPALLTHN